MFGTEEIIWIIVLYILLPIAAYWPVERAFGLAKMERIKRIATYASTAVGALVGWFLQMLFLPLGFVALFAVPFAVLAIIKVPLRKCVGVAIAWSVGYFFTLLAGTAVMLSMYGFS